MSTATLDTKTSEQAAEAPVLLAVSYLRVSTREQAERGGTDEGFSIPAQREANAAEGRRAGRADRAGVHRRRGVGTVCGS
jgi:site-specific DNA recombinase